MKRDFFKYKFSFSTKMGSLTGFISIIPLHSSVRKEWGYRVTTKDETEKTT